MRNLLLYLAVTLCTLSFIENTHAQENPKHMKFMNISLNDKFEPFLEKLKQKGFRDSHMIEDGSMLDGKLYDDRVNVSVIYAPTSKVVNKILVIFNIERKFAPAYQKYSNYIGALSEKYGKPTDLSDTTSYVPLNKNYKDNLKFLTKDGKEYITVWYLPEGAIELVITKDYSLCLTYYDRTNTDIHIKELKEIIDKEL